MPINLNNKTIMYHPLFMCANVYDKTVQNNSFDELLNKLSRLTNLDEKIANSTIENGGYLNDGIRNATDYIIESLISVSFGSYKLAHCGLRSALDDFCLRLYLQVEFDIDEMRKKK